ncbi:MAG: hypothetical protein VXV92_05225, partial [Bacteroidota bacterium]|nr:hypothetical protein [Bacteroidota bacterium]
MKKYIYLILLLMVISCNKEKTSDSNLINFEDTILENTSDCFIEKKEIPNWQKTSYELFDINIPSNYQDLGGLGGYGVNTISVDYNNDG